ncbi:MAG: NAD/NADP octopine/nopaline dehydrogenase family protein [Oscillospiraceae bacterium]|nr:NAD/NADP octopine/nopaline dehydrogenase family protein [Oscillospiraceae bacterium]
MNVTVVGGGNVGTQLAVHCANAGHRVTMYTSRSDKFSMNLTIVDREQKTIMTGSLSKATSDPEEAFKTAELIIITFPTFCLRDISETLLPYTHKGLHIAILPGAFGELFFKNHIEMGAVVFGLQRVPSVARLVEYGKTVCATGYRNELFAAAMPHDQTAECCHLMEDIIGIKCSPIPCYLDLTLTPSNPILHTTRLRTIFKDYVNGTVYDSLPLFYEDWTDESSKLLLSCDEEVQMICYHLPDLDLSYVRSLKEHYESSNAEQITAKISNIAGFRGLPTPCIKTNGKYKPDFESRYFKADFAYGLEMIRQFAALSNTNAPNINETIEWYYKVTSTAPVVDIGEFGIDSIDSIYEFYSL